MNNISTESKIKKINEKNKKYLLFIYSLTSSVNLKSDAYCNRIRPYTVSVSHRFTSYTVPVYGSCVRPPYVSVFHRKQSFTTVHVPPGLIVNILIW